MVNEAAARRCEPLLGDERINSGHHAADLGQHPPSERGNLVAGFGQLGAAGSALQQAGAERALKLAHAHADGGLGHTVTGRGLAQAAQLRDRVQQVQGDQVRGGGREHPPG